MTDCRLELKATRACNPRFLQALGAIALLAAAAAGLLVEQSLAADATWLGYGTVLAAALSGCLVMNRTRPNDRCVALEGRRLTVPAPSGFGRRAVTLDIGALRSVELTGRGAQRLRLNLPARVPITLHTTEVQSGNLADFHQRLLAAGLRLNPELSTALTLFQRRRQPPLATLLIGTVLLLVFLAHPSGNDDPVHHLIVLGGLNDWLVGAGELYRLGAAALLHADALHLAINLAFLLVIGLRLEYVTGPLALAGAFATGCVAGNLAALATGGHTVVVGASGGVYGLLALYAHSLWAHRRHLPTQTQFASNVYLTGGLLLLFVPLPGVAVSVHVGGFLGGALWSMAAGSGPRTRLTALLAGLAAWAFIALAGGYGWASSGRWLAQEDGRIRQMASDPGAGIGTLDLVGWYALRHGDEALMATATARLAARNDHTSSSAGTLAEMLLAQGEPGRAATFANQALELRADPEARDRLLRAELAAYGKNCSPIDYTATIGGVAPPRAIVANDGLTFAGAVPLYVHASVNGRYVLVPTGVPIPGARGAEAVVLGYGDRLPWRRKPRVQPLPAGANPSHCPRLLQ